jgi:hypothetical protein
VRARKARVVTPVVAVRVMMPPDSDSQKAQQAARFGRGCWRKRHKSNRDGNEHQQAATHGTPQDFDYVVTNILSPNRFPQNPPGLRIRANLAIDTTAESRYRSAAKTTRRMGLRLSKTLLILSVALSGLSFGATASRAQGTAQEEGACRPDVMRLCRAVAPDTGRVLACLQANRARLSRACRTVLQNHGQ